MCLDRSRVFQLLIPLLLAATANVSPTRANASELIVFQKQPAAAGDVSRQTIECDLAMEMSIRQGGQVVQAQNQTIERKQLRELTILNVGQQAPTRARIKFEESSVGLKTADNPPQSSPQPVTGKIYLVTRNQDRLAITYPDGSAPPEIETAIVAQNMESFGLPNPIANFFNERKIQIGETIQLPNQIARELLGFPDTVQNITQFQLRLTETKNVRGKKCAVFRIRLIADNAEAASLKMDLGGSLLLEIGTCRTVAVQLNGPVGASEMHGPPQGQFEVASKGNIRVAVESDYQAKVR